MRIFLEKSPLSNALGRATRVVEARNTYPILGYVLIHAEGDSVTVRATDLDIEIEERIPGRIQNGGTITLPARTLTDIVRKAPDGAEIEIAAEGEKVTVKYGRSRFQMMSLSPDSFPTLKVGEFPCSFTMPTGDLLRLISKTSFAMSTEETRYYLCGIYLHALEVNGEARLRAVATDGHRLARVDAPAPDGSAAMPAIILPRKLVGQIDKFTDGSAEVDLSVSDSKFRLAAGSLVVTGRLIEGTFPDYQRVTPKASNQVAELDVKEIVGAIGRVSILSDSKKTKATKLHIDGDLLTLSTSGDGGEGVEDVAVSWSGEPFDIGFNGRYLGDILAQIDSERVSFSMTDPGAPALVFSADDPSAAYVAMPMRVA